MNTTGNSCTSANGKCLTMRVKLNYYSSLCPLENSTTVLSPNVRIAVALSVILGSVLLLLAGFILGYCLGRKYKQMSTSVAMNQDTPVTQNLELTNNVAYAIIN